MATLGDVPFEVALRHSVESVQHYNSLTCLDFEKLLERGTSQARGGIPPCCHCMPPARHPCRRT
eukprot:552440-Amphidinium_carterae.1